MSLKNRERKTKCRGGIRVGYRRRGSTLVEFAMVVPLLIAMLIGIVEFGVLTNYKLRVANAAREGARYAALGKSPALIKERIRQYCAPLVIDTASTSTEILLNYESTKDEANPDYDATIGTSSSSTDTNNVPSGHLMRIEINTPHKPLLALVPRLNSFRLRANVVMRRE